MLSSRTLRLYVSYIKTQIQLSLGTSNSRDTVHIEYKVPAIGHSAVSTYD